MLQRRNKNTTIHSQILFFLDIGLGGGALPEATRIDLDNVRKPKEMTMMRSVVWFIVHSPFSSEFKSMS